MAFLALWQVVVLLKLPWVGRLPSPLDVALVGTNVLHDPSYYLDWLVSLQRVFVGFLIALGIGVPLGLAFGLSRNFREIAFPVFEVFRPIPPLAWIPLSILFWPTTESSIEYVIVLGALFVVTINTMAGVERVDRRYINAALSLGAKPVTLFRRVIFPATLPSITVGATIGMGLTWSVLVAAEIISGQHGLGRRTWEAYVAGTFPYIIVGMISMGIAGFGSSALIRAISARLIPWAGQP